MSLERGCPQRSLRGGGVVSTAAPRSLRNQARSRGKPTLTDTLKFLLSVWIMTLERDVMSDFEPLCDAFFEGIAALQSAIARADLSHATPTEMRELGALAAKVAGALDKLQVDLEQLRAT